MTMTAKLIIAGVLLLIAGVYGALYALIYKMLFVPNIARYTKPQDPLGGDWEAMKPFRPMLEEAQTWYRAQTVEDCWMTAYDGLKLHAELVRAASGNEKGTVLFVHGWHGMPLRDFAPVFRQMYAEGYNLMMIDQRAHGKSEGGYTTFAIRERFDCRDWITYLNTTLGHEKPIFLYGISMGCSTVLMTTGFDLPSNVKGIIADCGFTSPYDQMAYLLRTAYHLPVWPTLAVADRLTRKYAGFGLKEYSTLTALKTDRIPVLFVNGDDDQFVSPEMTAANYQLCPAEKERLIVKGAPHSLSNCYDNAGYLAAALAFFRRFST